MKKARVVILVLNLFRPILHFYQVSSKYSIGYSSYRAITIKFKQEGEITPKGRKPKLLFLYATHCLVLFYISIKYHENILMGI